MSGIATAVIAGSALTAGASVIGAKASKPKAAKQVDIRGVQDQASAIATENARNSMALENELTPEVAQLRSQSIANLLGDVQSGGADPYSAAVRSGYEGYLAPRNTQPSLEVNTPKYNLEQTSYLTPNTPTTVITPTTSATRREQINVLTPNAQLAPTTKANSTVRTTSAPSSVLGSGGTGDYELLGLAAQRAKEDLANAGNVPLDVRNQLARLGLAKSANVTGNAGLGRDITARDLGLTSLQLRDNALTRALESGNAYFSAGQNKANQSFSQALADQGNMFNQGFAQDNQAYEQARGSENQAFNQATTAANYGLNQDQQRYAQEMAKIQYGKDLEQQAFNQTLAAENYGLNRAQQEFGQYATAADQAFAQKQAIANYGLNESNQAFNQGLASANMDLSRSNAYDNNYFNALAGLQGVGQNEYSRRMALAGLGQSIARPEVGLTPGSVADLAVGNVNSQNAVNQQKAAINAQMWGSLAQTGGQIAGAGIGLAAANAARTPATPVAAVPSVPASSSYANTFKSGLYP